MSNGKGDSPRKKTVNWQTWDKNWEKIFGKREKNSRTPVDKPIEDDRIRIQRRIDQSRD
jgi:hypothetical protein